MSDDQLKSWLLIIGLAAATAAVSFR